MFLALDQRFEASERDPGLTRAVDLLGEAGFVDAAHHSVRLMREPLNVLAILVSVLLKSLQYGASLIQNTPAHTILAG